MLSSNSTQALFPLKVTVLFYSKYKAKPNLGPLSTSERMLFVKIAIVAKSSILNIDRAPKYASDKPLSRNLQMVTNTHLET